MVWSENRVLASARMPPLMIMLMMLVMLLVTLPHSKFPCLFSWSSVYLGHAPTWVGSPTSQWVPLPIPSNNFQHFPGLISYEFLQDQQTNFIDATWCPLSFKTGQRADIKFRDKFIQLKVTLSKWQIEGHLLESTWILQFSWIWDLGIRLCDETDFVMT